jgi:hypothetical protein
MKDLAQLLPELASYYIIALDSREQVKRRHGFNEKLSPIDFE